MGNSRGKKFRVRMGLVLLFTLLSCVFMYQGWYDPQIAQAAHTYDTKVRVQSATNPATLSYTCGSGATLLVLGIVTLGSTARTGGAPTYNGVAMTQVGTTRIATETNVELWYLVDPSTGAAYNISVPNSGSNTLNLVASSYKAAVGNTSALDVSNGTTGTTANPSLGVTTTVNGDAIVDVLGDGLNTAPTANSHTLLYSTDDGAYSDNAQYALQAAAGAITLSWTVAADDWAYIVAAFKEVTAAAATTTLGDGVAGTNATVCPGAANQKLDGFSFTASGTADSVTALTVTTTNQAAIASMQIWDEAGTTQYFSTVNNPGSNTWNFSGGTNPSLPAPLAGANYKILVIYRDQATAPAGDTATTASIASTTDFTCTNTKAGTDTADTTLTLNNSAPANPTGFSGTAGDAQVALSWTNPGDADFSQVVIFRYPTGAAFDTPVEGATYTQGTNTGLANNNNVVYVGSGTSTTDSGLTNGTAYNYKIFAKDNCGNYSTGVTAGPYTPNTTLTVADGANRPAAATWCPSAVNVIDQFKLTASSGTITVTSITIQGSNSVTGNITTVQLFKDVNNNGTYESGTDTQVGTNQIFGGAPPTATFAGLSESINTTGTNYLVRYTVAAAPANGTVVTSQVTTVVAGGSPNINNTATVSNNMTIRLYPSLVTNFTATCAATSATLTWTNPSETNLAEVKVMRKTGGYPTGPSDAGATQVYDNLSPTPGAAVNQTDAGPLSGGITYYWAVYSKDSCGNWNSTTTAGSNAAFCTPVSVDTLTVSQATPPSANGTVNQGSVNNPIMHLRFSANANTITITSIKVKQLGTALSSDIASLDFYIDADASGTVNAGDSYLGSGAYNSADNTYKVSSLNFVVTSPTTRDILVTANIDTGAVAARTIQFQVLDNTYVTVNSPDLVSATGLPLSSYIFTIASLADSTGTGPTVQIINPKNSGVVSGTYKVQVQAYWGTSTLTANSVKLSTDGGGTYPNTMTQNSNYTITNGGIFEYTVSNPTAGSYVLKATAVSTGGANPGTGYSRKTVILVRPGKATQPEQAGDGNLLARDNSSMLCLDCHALVQTHSSQYTSTKYGNWAINCVECHQPHDTTNIYLMRTLVNTPSAGNRAVKFWNTTGDDGAGGSSYVHGNAGTDGICQVCHTQTTGGGAARWRYGSNAENAHYTAAAGTQRCTSCHSHTAGFQGAGACVDCHGQSYTSGAGTKTGQTIRQIVGAAGDFTLNKSGHLVNGDIATPYTGNGTPPAGSRGAEIVTNWDCIVCHAEGDYTSSGTTINTTNQHYKTSPSTDPNGLIALRNVDSPGNPGTDGTNFWNINNVNWATADFDKLDKFCVSCHDANGASGITVNGVNTGLDVGASRPRATTPFNTADNFRNAFDKFVRTGVTDVKTAMNKSNYSVHAMSVNSDPGGGNFGQRYTSLASTPWPAGAWTGKQMRDGQVASTAREIVTLHCSDCHLSSINAHGARLSWYMLDNSGAVTDATYNASYLTYGTDAAPVWGTGATGTTNYGCLKCHAKAVYNFVNSNLSAYRHDDDGSGNLSDNTVFAIYCLNCHGGGNGGGGAFATGTFNYDTYYVNALPAQNVGTNGTTNMTTLANVTVTAGSSNANRAYTSNTTGPPITTTQYTVSEAAAATATGQEFFRAYTPVYTVNTTIAANATAYADARMMVTGGTAAAKATLYEYNDTTGIVGAAKGTASFTLNTGVLTRQTMNNVSFVNASWTVTAGNRLMVIYSFDMSASRPAYLWGQNYSATPSGYQSFRVTETPLAASAVNGALGRIHGVNATYRGGTYINNTTFQTSHRFFPGGYMMYKPAGDDWTSASAGTCYFQSNLAWSNCGRSDGGDDGPATKYYGRGINY